MNNIIRVRGSSSLFCRPPAMLPSCPWGALMACFAAVFLASRWASADVVTWDVDPASSYIRLTIPDQGFDLPDVGTVTLRMRDANSSSQWTDAGGRRAALDGEIVTDYAEGVSIVFLGGQHALHALDGTSLRPNPAKWDAATTNYTDTSTAPAALGGRVRGTLILTFDVAYAAFRGVQLDLTNVVAGPIPIVNGAFAANTTRFGIASALADVDGLELPLGLGQPVPDVRQADLGRIVELNTAGGTITDLGGRNRKLTYTISMPNLVLDLGGTPVTGSAAGQIVAHATLPAPPPPAISVRQVADGIVLSWPSSATGYSLEYATALPAASWWPASPPPVVADGQNVVTNHVAGVAAFYRLRKPE